MRRRSAGFTLIEIAVAMAILGAGVVTLQQIYQGALRLQERSSRRSRVVLHARAAMDALLVAREVKDHTEERTTQEGFKTRVLVRRAKDLLALEVARVPPDLLDLRLHLVFARLEAVHLGLRRFDEEVELADLGRDLLLLGRDLREDARGCHRQLPISGPLIQPCRIA
jgi:prepilin-type N-terminal cleavage/methylation domain-containing protein